MLVTGRVMDCPFIWNHHVAIGREAGLSDALVDALRDKHPLPSMPLDEAIVLNYGMELLQNHQVKRETFQRVLDLLDVQATIELTTLIGFYTMLAFNANAVDLDLPPHITELPLPV